MTYSAGYPIAYATPARRAELRAMPYVDYLRTPEWKQVRWVALHEGGHRCRLCPNMVGLDVHHPHGYECRGAETIADVVVLCRDCHEREHVTRAPQADAGPLPPRPPLTGAAAELDRLRCEILASRAAGDDSTADRLTSERDALWRSLARAA